MEEAEERVLEVRLNMYVWSAPATGFKVHNDKAYNLSSPAIWSLWVRSCQFSPTETLAATSLDYTVE